ncbi:MAG: FAD-dependent oxidoreductase [Candidatus Omnitrophica bacterium]|nr:FAD-dependent oxidoreductase [Candidatus Omnitrophota bacterium]
MTGNRNKIIIIGGGFSGTAALKALRRYGSELNIVLIDKKKDFEFLPLLPNVISSRLSEKSLAIDLKSFCKRYGAEFVNDEAVSIDFVLKRVVTKNAIFSYDYLIVASGATNNFYGNKDARQLAFKLYSISDAILLRDTVQSGKHDNFVIIGGGYTGIEIATNIWRNLKKTGREKNIYIVERSSKLLSSLPDGLSSYTTDNLKRLQINVLYNASVKNIQKDFIILSDGRAIKNALIVWAAGVKTSDYMDNFGIALAVQGRLKVDEFLQFEDSCFAVGDSANLLVSGTAARMAINVSLYEGASAGENLIRKIKGKPLKKFKPVDLGYIIPMANGRSCGLVLGREVYGILPTFLHYMMCAYRSVTLRNKLEILSEWIKGGIV